MKRAGNLRLSIDERMAATPVNVPGEMSLVVAIVTAFVPPLLLSDPCRSWAVLLHGPRERCRSNIANVRPVSPFGH